jgi:hypothetical protein
MTRIGSLIARNGVSDNNQGDRGELSGPQTGGDGIPETDFVPVALGSRFTRKPLGILDRCAAVHHTQFVGFPADLDVINFAHIDETRQRFAVSVQARQGRPYGLQ